MWKRFDKKKPKKDGWYECTVEVKGQQRYVMQLFWYNDTQRFISNIRLGVFEEYTVSNYKGKRLYRDRLCDRTDSVIAWRKCHKPYMKGFILEER